MVSRGWRSHAGNDRTGHALGINCRPSRATGLADSRWFSLDLICGGGERGDVDSVAAASRLRDGDGNDLSPDSRYGMRMKMMRIITAEQVERQRCSSGVI